MSKNVVIVGAQWGDEGKGKIVDLLTEQADIIVRFQGGPNAGHTVVVGDKRTILHQIPSGILHPGKKCIIGNGVVIDIEALLNEITELKSQGYFKDDTALLISERAHLIMPYHKRIDLAREKSKGKNKIGTTGRGIGPAYEDKVGRGGIRIVDLFNDSVFIDKLKSSISEKNFWLQNYFKEEPMDIQGILDQFLVLRTSIAKYIADTSLYLHRALTEKKKVLFEGAQGSMLDVDHGTYPFVTSSNTAAAQASIGSGIGPRHLDRVIGVAKAYTTRVGGGPFPTEQDAAVGTYLRDKGAEYGATTGRPRRCGWLDLMTVRHAIQLNSISHLIITKLDVLSGLESIKVCKGYTYAGKAICGFPADLSILEQCTPVYDELDGWNSDLSGVSRFAELPPAAQAYLQYISEKTGIPNMAVSVGSRRDQIIMLQDPLETSF